MFLTRRAFIKASAFAPLVSWVGLSPAMASDPATIIAALTIFHKILQLQSQRGDGGTGAVLNAVNNKLDVVISQLATIEGALAKITLQISALQEATLKAIAQQYAVQLFNEIRTGLVKIRDVQTEARSKGISLDVRNPARQGLESRLDDAWKEFDVARRRLREYPQGRGMVSVTLLDAFVLADQTAFAAGLIGEVELSIIMDHHLAWLKDMVDPDLDFSVAADKVQFSADEIAERTLINDAAKTPSDGANAIAAALLEVQSTQICSLTTMDVKFWSEYPTNGWYYLRGNKYLMAPTYSVSHVNTLGAIQLKNVQYHTTYVFQVVLGNGHVQMAFGDVASIDQTKCRSFANSEAVIDASTVHRLQIQNDAHDSMKFKNGIGPAISGIFTSKSEFAKSISTGGLAMAVEVQKVLDRVNLHILNKRLAETAAELIASNRAFAKDLAAALPPVPR